MSRILWHSGAPWAPTGYGNQTATFTPRIRDAGHDVAISSTWGLGGYTLEWNGMPVYPADGLYGRATMPHFADRFEADLVITLMDVWLMRDWPGLKGLNLASWVPVDHDPCPPDVANFFRQQGSRPIAMSRFGEQMLRDEGLDPLYVPHGVDTNVFKPFTEADRAAFREKIGWPADAFVVGMVANNQGRTPPRKAFPQAIQAFAAFRQEHPDAYMYFHSEVSGTRERGDYAGVDLLGMCDMFEIPPDRIGFTKQIELEAGFPTPLMATLYASMDVLLNPSYGEGFGIPIVEAQACGTPVIVTNWTAMPELCGAGWLVGGEPYFDVLHKSFFMAPFVGDIIEALNQAHTDAASLRPAAREFALRYDADRVMAEHWLPVLEALSRPREVAPLPNRAMRRAKQKVSA